MNTNNKNPMNHTPPYPGWDKVTRVVGVISLAIFSIIGIPFILYGIDNIIYPEKFGGNIGPWPFLAVALVVAVVYSYVSFLQRKVWARKVIVVISFLQLLALPVGTLLGALMLAGLYKNKGA